MRTLAAHGLLLCLTASCYADPPTALAIRNARIVTISGPTLAKGTVVVRNGLIEAVGDSVTVPPDAWVVEGDNLTVYPGLMDALSTWALPDTAAGPARPPGTPAAPPAPRARGPEDRPSASTSLRAADLLQVRERRAEAARSAGFTSAVVFPTRGIFAGQGALVNLAGDRPGQMVVASPVGQYVSLAPQGFASFPGSLMGVLSYVRQLHLDRDHYVQQKARYAQNPAGLKRPDYDKTLEGLIESPRLLLPATEAYQIARMIAFIQELKVPAVLYGMHDAYRAADRLKQANLPVLVSLKWPEAPREPDPDAEVSLDTLQLRDKAPGTPAALAKAQVRFALYSDNLATPADVMRSVRKAIRAGLAHDDAVRAMTLSPAEIYGVADRLGSVDRGKIANLTVTRGNLFDEGAKVEFVVIDGVRHAPVPEATPAPGARPTE